MFYDSNKSSLPDWFEMKKLRTKNLDSAGWIPLFSIEEEQKGPFYKPDYEHNDNCARGILVPEKYFKDVYKLDGDCLEIIEDTDSCVDEDGVYIPCDEFRDSVVKEESERKDQDDCRIDIQGIYPVLIQTFDRGKTVVWNLHQDIVIALKLLRENDKWVRPDEGYAEVARIIRDSNDKPQKLEIKNEFLKDYLCARKMGLYVLTYHSRQMIFAEKPTIDWTVDQPKIEFENGKWCVSFRGLTKNGLPVGEKVRVITGKRNDIDPEDDVPVIDFPGEDDIRLSIKDVVFPANASAYEVLSELWKNELILPGLESIRVRGDEPKNFPFFKIDASGQSLPSNELKDSGRWLWFDAEVMNALLSRRNGILKWYTSETGSIGYGPEHSAHFGINDLGLITVYAKAIVSLPIWIQQIWAGHNVTPDGGVSKELLMAQANQDPASTQAPESRLKNEYKSLNKLFKDKYGIDLFNVTQEVEKLLVKVNRFESVSQDGFFRLAKDLAKLVCDSINWRPLQKKLTKVEDKWRSMKTLQEFLMQKESLPEEQVKALMAPFYGIDDLRQTDAHISGPNAEKAMKSVGINKDLNPLFRGRDMLSRFVETIATINKIISKA